MKYFLTGMLLALFIGVGASALAVSFEKVQIEDGVARNCTWTEVKLCYDGISNPCCPPKVMMDQPEEIVKNCTWSEVKNCYSGNPSPNNQCCPPKYIMDNPISAIEEDNSVAKNCTWTEVKLCYDGIPNRCCPPKNMQMV